MKQNKKQIEANLRNKLASQYKEKTEQLKNEKITLEKRYKEVWERARKAEIKCDELTRTTNEYKFSFPYSIKNWSYTPNGTYYFHEEDPLDIVNFIPKCQTIDLEMLKYCRKDFEFMQTLSKAIKNMNTLEIKIPEGKEIDWKQSEKENKIVLKDKQLTYEDICKKLFEDNHYTIAWEGYPIECSGGIYNASNATTKHQLECILAKNMLANVAKYLNDGWKPNNKELVWYIAAICLHSKLILKRDFFRTSFCSNTIIFKSDELAQQAIEILGEETVKLALEPLGF